MKISYIVSTYQNALYLPCCLWSLRGQTDQDFEVIITDNSETMYQERIMVTARSVFPHCAYIPTMMPTCFHSAEIGVKYAKGEFICLPSDDSYYVPTFGEIMYRAAIDNSADLVMCDLLYDPRNGHGNYRVVDQHPRRGWFDKTGFILRRDKFQSFSGKRVHEPRTSPIEECADGLLAEKLVAEGITYYEVRSALAVHN